MEHHMEWIFGLVVLLGYWICCKGVGASQELCTIEVERNRIYEPFDAWAFLNCTSNCTPIFWESRLQKENETKGDSWSSIEVRVADWEESRIQCANLASDQKTVFRKEITVRAYALPSSVTIDLEELMEEGTSYNVTCTVYDVAPAQNLLVTVTREGDVIHSKSFHLDTRNGKVNVSVTQEITAQRADNLQNFSCNALLDVGTLITTTSSATVQTYSLPAPPQIFSDKWIPLEETVEIICEIRQQFPPENVTLELLFNSKPLNVTMVRATSGAVAGSFHLTPTEIGKYELTCIARILGLSKAHTVDVNIYEPPIVNFTLSDPSLVLNNSMTTFCHIMNLNPELYTIEISVNGERRCETESTPELTCNITADRRAPVEMVTCIVNLRENPNITKTAQENLTVFYGPEFRADLCPDIVTLVEGMRTPIPCQADGNPPPQVTCNSDNLQVHAGTFIDITRNLSREFQCMASNSQGVQHTHLRLSIEYYPDTPTLTVEPSTDIVKGNSVNLTCQSDGFPPPEYHWQIPPNVQVVYSMDNSTISIPKMTSYHTGTYICQARNKHGERSQQKYIQMSSDNMMKWIGAGILIGILGLVLIGALTTYYLWKSGRIGSYSVSKSKPRPPQSDDSTPLKNGPFP